MNTMTKHDRITKHGENLLAIFPKAKYQDPVQLYRALRRIEMPARRHAERLCSDEWYCNHRVHGTDTPWHEVVDERLTQRLHDLLGSDRPWTNGDPRGYGLKVNLKDGETLHTDWGGYGILAPDFD